MKTIVFAFLILICSPVMFPHASLAQDGRPIVRLIYFLPKDRTPQPDIDAKMDTLIKNVQQFYADQMAAHGFGRKTFRFETDTRGKTIVHHVKGKFRDGHYHNETVDKVKTELNDTFDLAQTIHFISIDIGSEIIDTHACGVGGIEGTSLGGFSLLPASGNCFVGDFGVDVAAHELGHAFGLQHDFRNDAYLMSYGSERDRLSACAAEWLDAHPAFNPGSATLSQDTTIKMLPPRTPSAPNAIRFRFEVTDPDGIHQVQLLTPTTNEIHDPLTLGYLELLAYERLDGRESDTVEFRTTELTQESESVSLMVIDRNGNMTISRSYSIYISVHQMPPKVVTIPDPHLAEAVRQEIGEPITTHTMFYLTSLNVRGRGITDLTGLEHAYNLESLEALGNPISDVSPLAGLTQLTELNIRGTEVADISPLTGLTQLTLLSLGYKISDLSPLAGLTQLKRLYLIGVPISDLSPLAGLTQLERLDLRGTEVLDVAPLAGLTQLKRLWLLDTAISDISPLAGLTQMEHLYLSNTAVSDIAPLTGMTRMKYLFLDDTPISDIVPLAGMMQMEKLGLSGTSVSNVSPLAGLTQLNKLWLYETSVSDISALAGLTEMKELLLQNTPISDIAPLAGMTQMTRLDLDDTPISDISVLTGMTEMKNLGLDDTAISDISALTEMTQLTLLWLRNTTVSDISALTEMTEMKRLLLSDNAISDISPLAGMTRLDTLWLRDNAISDISPLAGMTEINTLLLDGNAISDVAPLVGMTQLNQLWIHQNPLSYTSINTYMPAIQALVPEVIFDFRTPKTLAKISGGARSGFSNTTLPRPCVVEVRDQQNSVFSGVPVTFSITAGDGKLSITTTKTDTNGRAETHLTLGATVGTITIRVSVPEISQSAQFTVTAVRPDTEITIPDAALRTQIAETLSKPGDAPITVLDILQLTQLTANNTDIRDLSGLQHAANLTTLSLDGNNIRDVARLVGLTQLQTLSLDDNNITDVSRLAELTQLQALSLDSNNITEVASLTGLQQLQTLSLNSNHLTDVAPFTTLTQLKTLDVGGNLLSYPSLYTAIPIIQTGGATVTFDLRTPTTLVNLSGTLGLADRGLPVIIEIQDEQGVGFAGVPVTFSIAAGGGSLSASNVVTDGIGRAQTLFTLGKSPGEQTLRVVPPEPLQPISFRITVMDPNTPVNVPDANLRGKIAELSGKPRDVQLTVSDMLGFTRLTAIQENIQDLTGLEHAHNLKDLFLGGNPILDITPLTGLTQLTELLLNDTAISDISPLAGLTKLTRLVLSDTPVSDISALEGLTQLTHLVLDNTVVSDVTPLAELTQLKELWLSNTAVSDIAPLAGLTQMTRLGVGSNSLNYASLHTHIPAMQARGGEVYFDERTYPALDIISGTGQQASGGASLADPFVVAAIDANGTPMSGVSVIFTVTQGNGDLGTITATTDANGRAETTFTLGPDPGRHSMRATAVALKNPVVNFIAVATAPVPQLTADVNGDGTVNIQDLVIVSSRLGQTGQDDADVNGDGTINIQDLVFVAGALGTDAAAPTAWHRTAAGMPTREKVAQWLTQAHRLSPTDTRSQRGVFLLERLLAALAPKETALLANYPNPFNPETWIPYQLAQPAEVTLTLYAVDGSIVRTLDLGHQAAGIYQTKNCAAYWDGRNVVGEPVASGLYFYTLTAGDFTATRKMLIRK